MPASRPSTAASCGRSRTTSPGGRCTRGGTPASAARTGCASRRGHVRTTLVVYGLLQHPLRSTVEDHLYALRRYSQARVFHANVAVGPVPRWMRGIRYDAIVFHTSL